MVCWALCSDDPGAIGGVSTYSEGLLRLAMPAQSPAGHAAAGWNGQFAASASPPWGRRTGTCARGMPPIVGPAQVDGGHLLVVTCVSRKTAKTHHPNRLHFFLYFRTGSLYNGALHAPLCSIMMPLCRVCAHVFPQRRLTSHSLLVLQSNDKPATGFNLIKPLEQRTAWLRF